MLAFGLWDSNLKYDINHILAGLSVILLLLWSYSGIIFQKEVCYGRVLVIPVQKLIDIEDELIYNKGGNQ